MTAPASVIFSRTTGNGLEFKRLVEVVIKAYRVPEELQEGDVYLRQQDAEYGTGQDVVVRRLVPLSEDEAALVQAGVNYGQSSAR